MEVIKRDGRKESWNPHKIENAVRCAAQEVEDAFPADIASKVEAKLKGKEQTSVADIHSAVESILMASRYKNTARAYIEKRSQRDREREAGGKLFQDITSFINQTSE